MLRFLVILLILVSSSKVFSQKYFSPKTKYLNPTEWDFTPRNIHINEDFIKIESDTGFNIQFITIKIESSEKIKLGNLTIRKIRAKSLDKQFQYELEYQLENPARINVKETYLKTSQHNNFILILGDRNLKQI